MMKRLLVVLAVAATICGVVASCSNNNPPECFQTDDGCVPTIPGDDDAGVQCGSTVCSGSAPACNTTTNECVACTATAGCSGLAGVCDTSVDGGACIECASSPDCPSDAPNCQAGFCFSSDGGRPLLPDGGTAGGPGGGAGGGSGGGSGGGAGGGAGGGTGGGGGGGAGSDGGVDGGFIDGGFIDGGSGPGDNCNSVIPIVFDGGTSATFSITTAGARNDFNGGALSACQRFGANNGPDVVYELTLTGTRNIAVSAAPTGATPPNIALYVVQEPCGTGAQRACSNDLVNASAAETVNIANAPAGRYYIVFDSTTNGAGPGPADVVISVTP